MWIGRACLPITAPWLSVLMRATSPLCFWFFFNLFYFVGVEGRYCCSYWRTITPSSLFQGHCRGRVSGSTSARRCQPFWGRLGELDASREGEGRVLWGAICHFVKAASCSDVWTVFFFSVIENECDWRSGRGAFELPSIIPALGDSYLCLQLTHREAEPWSKSKLDQNWLSTPHLDVSTDVGGSPCRKNTATYNSITSYFLDSTICFLSLQSQCNIF